MSHTVLRHESHPLRCPGDRDPYERIHRFLVVEKAAGGDTDHSQRSLGT